MASQPNGHEGQPHGRQQPHGRKKSFRKGAQCTRKSTLGLWLASERTRQKRRKRTNHVSLHEDFNGWADPAEARGSQESISHRQGCTEVRSGDMPCRTPGQETYPHEVGSTLNSAKEIGRLITPLNEMNILKQCYYENVNHSIKPYICLVENNWYLGTMTQVTDK